MKTVLKFHKTIRSHPFSTITDVAKQIKRQMWGNL